MSKGKPFLGETHDRAKAFPGIIALELTVTQDRWEHYTTKDWQRKSHYTLDNIQPFHRCANPRCQQGGLNLQHVVLYQSNGEHTMYCNGHEGTPAGRRKGDPCDNSFVVTLNKTETGK
ncbi:hypothetical protein [Sphingobium sp. MK2]|uniref:hypothetical protein n=1 Tax=Sphingobium sp. MK2 TaxID=3116540 RepID=UPI0032E3582A